MYIYIYNFSIWIFHSLSNFVNPVGQSGTFKTQKSLKQKPKGAFRLSLGNSLEKLPCSKSKVCTAKFQTVSRGLESLDIFVMVTFVFQL